jgi:hypothetical protein
MSAKTFDSCSTCHTPYPITDSGFYTDLWALTARLMTPDCGCEIEKSNSTRFSYGYETFRPCKPHGIMTFYRSTYRDEPMTLKSGYLLRDGDCPVCATPLTGPAKARATKLHKLIDAVSPCIDMANQEDTAA